MFRKLLSNSRYTILLAVFGSFVAATALLLYGSVRVVVVVAETLQTSAVTSKGAKTLALAFIEIVDIFLLGAVFYIIALAACRRDQPKANSTGIRPPNSR